MPNECKSSIANTAWATHATASPKGSVLLSASLWYRSPPGRYSIANTTLRSKHKKGRAWRAKGSTRGVTVLKAVSTETLHFAAYREMSLIPDTATRYEFALQAILLESTVFVFRAVGGGG